MRRIFLSLFIIVTGVSTLYAQGEGLVPDHQEYLALKDLYTNTGGADWYNTTNWPTSWPATASNAEFGTWFGVSVQDGDVVQIALSGNNLQNSLPSTLNNLSELRVFAAGGNQLEGSFPTFFFSLSKLSMLEIAYNQFTGTIPSFSSAQFNAYYITIGSNGFTGDFPDLSSQTNLHTLSLASINFTPGPIPNWFSSLTNLGQVYLGATNRTENIPYFFGTSFPNMRVLDMENNQFTGSIPTSLGNLTNLEQLFLFSNQLEGPIPPSFGRLTNLITLYLSSNKLTSIPRELGDMQSLQQLILDDNLLEGAVPAELAEAPNLHNVSLNNNKLSVLPDLSALTLDALQLSNNKFSGPLPSWIASETSLRFLRIANNQFTGPMPAGFASLVNMFELTMDHNKFTGTFPDISSWNGLFSLNIASNQFKGDFPDVPSSLGVVDMTDNHFTSIPTSLFSINNNYYSLLYNNQIKEVRGLQTGIANGTIHPSNSGYFYMTNNQLDFSQVMLLKQIQAIAIIVLPQNDIQDITKQAFIEGSVLQIPSRSLSPTTSVVWEYRKNNAAPWSDVTSLSEDASRQTFKRTTSTRNDQGEYRWRSTDSANPEAANYPIIQSLPIEVKENKVNIVDSYAFQYKYDERNRMTHKKIPGAEWVYMVYDERDRLVLTQDGEQRRGNKWMFTKYDEYNRPVLTGIYYYDSIVDQRFMQDSVVNKYYNKLAQNHGNWYESFTTGNYAIHGYDNKSFPVIYDPGNCLTVKYYDSYDFLGAWGSDYNYVENDLLPVTVANSGIYSQVPANKLVYGQITGTKTRTVDGAIENNFKFLKSITYFDEQYRTVQVISDNNQGSTDRLTNILDFSGSALKTKTTHGEGNLKWKDTSWAAVSANSAGSTISGLGANPRSVQSIDPWENGSVSFRVEQMDTQSMMISLMSEDGTDSFGFWIGSGTVQVYEDNAPVISYSGFWPTDVFKIERQGTTVTFSVQSVNDIWTYSSSKTSTSSLYLNAQLNGNSTISDIKTSFAPKATKQYIERLFTYDHSGRLLTTHHSINGATPILLSKKVYNELGQLVDKDLHSTDGTTFKQSIDYRYTIRGWLESINNASLTTGSGTNNEDDSNTGRDLFGMELYYEKEVTGLTSAAENELQYNGNISATIYSNNLATGSIKNNGYKFNYDPMNRLKNANFRQKSLAGWNVSLQNSDPYSETGFRYDLNGNIEELHRSGAKGTAEMDYLKYTYEGNQLMKVEDEGDITKGFADGNLVGNDYQYDANGNMISDSNKGISAIGYNHMNLSDHISKTSGEYLRYFYDASGRKLSQHVFDASGQLKKKSDYAGEYLYENDTLKAILHEEGRVVINRTPSTEPQLVANYDGSNPSDFFTYAGLHGTLSSVQQGGETYLKFTNADYRWAGPMSSSIPVTVGETYKFRVKGYTAQGDVYPYVMAGNGGDVVWYYKLPVGAANEAWVESTFVVPSGVSNVHVGALFDYMPDPQDAFYMNAIELYKVTNPGPILTYEYQYHLKDHLGNVRGTFTTKEEMEEFIATMEDEYENTERSEFLKYDDSRRVFDHLFDRTNGAGPTTTPGYSIRLNGSENERNGIAKSFSVMPGDKIDMQVFGKYIDPNFSPDPSNATNVQLWQALGIFLDLVEDAAQTVVKDGAGYMSATLRIPPTAEALTDPNESSEFPKAHLNWAIFDREWKFLDGGARQLQGGAEDGTDVGFGEINASVNIDEPGYVYVWLSNTSDEPRDVFFDDFKVKHTKSPLIQQNQYYPFGLTFNNYQKENSMKNKFLYSGKELQNELDLGWVDFGARMYMPEIGRWGVNDPLAESYESISPYNSVLNNPIRFFDFDGGGPGDIVIIIPGADFLRTNDLGYVGPLAHQINNDGGITKVFPGIVTQSRQQLSLDPEPLPLDYNLIPGLLGWPKFTTDQLDKATQAMYDYIVENKQKSEGKLIIYGYSWGGVLAGHIARRLEAKGIKIDQLFLVDAAASRTSDHIDRSIPDNVDEAHVYWTDNKGSRDPIDMAKTLIAWSSGGPGHRKEGSKAKIVDNNYMDIVIKWGGQNGKKKQSVRINHTNIDDESWAQILKLINDFLNQKQ